MLRFDKFCNSRLLEACTPYILKKVSGSFVGQDFVAVQDQGRDAVRQLNKAGVDIVSYSPDTDILKGVSACGENDDAFCLSARMRESNFVYLGSLMDDRTQEIFGAHSLQSDIMTKSRRNRVVWPRVISDTIGSLINHPRGTNLFPGQKATEIFIKRVGHYSVCVVSVINMKTGSSGRNGEKYVHASSPIDNAKKLLLNYMDVCDMNVVMTNQEIQRDLQMWDDLISDVTVDLILGGSPASAVYFELPYYDHSLKRQHVTYLWKASPFTMNVVTFSLAKRGINSKAGTKTVILQAGTCEAV